mmetsp:Transcript_17290/g.65489  ORF Transcript_17290/g.65489 Transcript_17290/m.65489 type:complete len:217 (-) Transcript_17290:3980-4630(-)
MCAAAALVDGSQRPCSPDTKSHAHEERSGLGPWPRQTAMPTLASPATCGRAGSPADAGRTQRGNSDKLDVKPSTNGERSCDNDSVAPATGRATLVAVPGHSTSGSGPSLHSSSRSDAPWNEAARSTLWVGSSPQRRAGRMAGIVTALRALAVHVRESGLEAGLAHAMRAVQLRPSAETRSQKRTLAALTRSASSRSISARALLSERVLEPTVSPAC